MTITVLSDELGPRARRRVAITTALSVVALGLVVVVALRRLSATGQLDAERWRPFTNASVLRFLLGGLVGTLKAASLAMVIALMLGLLMALGRLARGAPLRWAAGAYVEFFRAVPLILLILFCGIGLPRYGVTWGPFWFLVMALVAYNSAVLAEIFRAGIKSIDRGQGEAAAAIGLSDWQTMRMVLVPQAVRRMVPAVVSQLVTLLKDTSLGFVISYEELLRRSRSTGEFFKNPLQTLVVVALIYVLVNLALSRLASRLEARQRRRPKSAVALEPDLAALRGSI